MKFKTDTTSAGLALERIRRAKEFFTLLEQANIVPEDEEWKNMGHLLRDDVAMTQAIGEVRLSLKYPTIL